MNTLLFAVCTQAITLLPLALAIYISFYVLNATDMTLDGSFVLGAGIFARLIEANIAPYIAFCAALLVGIITGISVAIMQREQKINSLLAGILATFILASVNLLVMGRPNISLLEKTTLVSNFFANSSLQGWIIVSIYSGIFCSAICLLMTSRLGLILRSFGDNPYLLNRLGKNVEHYRMLGFAITNCLAAFSGCLTAQTVGYADIGMGFGITLTSLGTVILGKQIITYVFKNKNFLMKIEFFGCLIGVLLYYFLINILLRLNVDPIYLKMLLGLLLVIFLRMAATTSSFRRLT